MDQVDTSALSWIWQAKKANQSEIYGQDSASRGALSETRNWKLENGNWKMETGNWGSQFLISSFCSMAWIQKRGTRNQKLENKAASFQFPVSIFQFLVSPCRPHRDLA
ncbi:MAG: hypothetical protein ABSH01_24980 [Terriglobia bacterium]|jgi:hypothetical protein